MERDIRQIMALEIEQQIHQILEDKKHVLITFQKNGKGDAIASSLALALFLEKLGKRVDIVCDEFTLPKIFKFLKKSDKIKSAFSHLQKFIITVDTEKTGIEELSYDRKDKKLSIFITPKNGFLSKDNIKTAQSEFKYDLIFTLDTEDTESLGYLYGNNTELFYKIPIINIDQSSANEHFGQINFIDINATSTCEILFNLFKKLGEEYIDENIATALLTGMIAKTHSFKDEHVQPYTLAIAGKLISMGAERDNIIKNLYRTRSISTLKLWGSALEHLKTDNNAGLVWTTLTRDNFIRSKANKDDLYDIIDELISNSPEAKITLLLHEHTILGSSHSVQGIIKTDKIYNAKALLKPFFPEGNATEATFVVTGKSLKEVEEGVVGNIRKVIL